MKTIQISFLDALFGEALKQVQETIPENMSYPDILDDEDLESDLPPFESGMPDKIDQQYDTNACLDLLCEVVSQAVSDYQSLKLGGYLTREYMQKMVENYQGKGNPIKIIGYTSPADFVHLVEFLRSDWPEKIVNLTGKDFPGEAMRDRLKLDEVNI
jgi:hypothetical protein